MALSSNLHGPRSTQPATVYREGRIPFEPPLHLRADHNLGAREVLENQHIADAIYLLLEYEYERKAETQLKADASWEAWNNHHDVGDKAHWQETARIPKVWIHVERAVAATMEFLNVTPDWFDIDSVLPSQELAINMVKELIRADLNDDRIGVWGTIEDCIRELYLTGNTNLFVGFERGRMPIMNTEAKPAEDAGPVNGVDFSFFGKDIDQIGLDLGVLKEREVDDSDDKILLPDPDSPRPRLDRVPFERVYRDTSGNNRYVIWTTYSSVGDFREEAKMRGWNPDAVERAISAAGPRSDWGGHGNVWRDVVYGEKGPVGDGYTFDYAIEIVNFQGTLYNIDAHGEHIFKDQYVVVANGHLLMDPIDPPFWDGELPIVQSKMGRNPQSVYGKSPIGENLDVFDLQIGLVLLLTDAIQRTLDPTYLVDKSVVRDNLQKKPMGPGVVYDALYNGQSSPGIQKVAAPEVDGNTANAFQMLNVILEGFTGATQEGGSAPRTRNRMTGVEFAAREQQSSTLIAHFFGNIDKQLLTPMLRLWFLRRLQLTPDKQWRLLCLSRKDRVLFKAPENVKSQWSEEIDEMAAWTAQERYKNLGAYLRFRVKVFGNALQRQMESEKVTGLLKVVQQSPEMLGALNLPYVFTKLVESLGWDPEEAINANYNVTPEVNADDILSGKKRETPPISQPGEKPTTKGPGPEPFPGLPTEAPTQTPGMK